MNQEQRILILMTTTEMRRKGNRMTLYDLVNSLTSVDEDKTIYAKRPWQPGTAVVVATELDEGGVPDEAAKAGAEYFLEVFLANDVLKGWLSSLDKEPTIEEKCLRLIKYAEKDA
ncbi:hypothetical protein QM201_16970 [Enterobacter asburiae]|nr:hypothetical protein [Enterobacter asburiae]